ncbi:MAG: c-type cytochrome [Burkholderiales bacterium]|nr:c-type cytochrome [Burkholderiales bacterium]MDE2394856.1 c-type cytochrome [Burkholderiales bacterium]MDE2456205.1 c-type cytochrome [Burkholderiales bacterium]
MAKLKSWSEVARGGVLALGLVLAAHGAQAAIDVDAAKETARQNNCFKCHGMEKAKDGPAWKAVAAKYKGKPEAFERLTKHLTTGEKAKFPDGHEENHKIVKVANQAELKNLIDWILSL